MEIILGKLLIYPIQMSSITLTTFSKSQYSLIIRPKTRLDFIRPKTRAQNTIGISIVGCSATENYLFLHDGIPFWKLFISMEFHLENYLFLHDGIPFGKLFIST